MNVNGRANKLSSPLYLTAITVIALMLYSIWSSFFTGKEVPSISAQSDAFMDRRINQIEQRFYTLESRINRLEYESRVPAATPGLSGNSEIEVRLLRSQIETLQLRVRELECALLKIDERTLSERARLNRNSSATQVDEPCRKNAGSPVKLSARP